MDYFSEMKQKHKKLFTISWRQSASCSVVSDSLWPNDYTVHGILQAKVLEWVAFPFSRDLPNPGIEPRSPALQADSADSLPAEPQAKPKNTGLGSLSQVSRHKGSLRILEWVAYRSSSRYSQPGTNQGLLHCRQILYQLSYQGTTGGKSTKFTLSCMLWGGKY